MAGENPRVGRSNFKVFINLVHLLCQWKWRRWPDWSIHHWWSCPASVLDLIKFQPIQRNTRYILSKQEPYSELWILCLQLLGISWGQASVEQGFSIDYQIKVLFFWLLLTLQKPSGFGCWKLKGFMPVLSVLPVKVSQFTSLMYVLRTTVVMCRLCCGWCVNMPCAYSRTLLSHVCVKIERRGVMVFNFGKMSSET